MPKRCSTVYAPGMSDAERLIVLGSRSPQRWHLLHLLIPEERIDVCPPANSDESGFDDIADWESLMARLSEIARVKNDDVLGQLRARHAADVVAGVLTADTVIVGRDDRGNLAVLGQPPDDAAQMRQVVGDWFRCYYLGRTHIAATAVCLTTWQGLRREEVVQTEVSFAADAEQWLDWYLATGEPYGKAGGYALQGAGDLFVSRVEGSLSNVVGLPLAETLEMLRELTPDVF